MKILIILVCNCYVTVANNACKKIGISVLLLQHEYITLELNQLVGVVLLTTNHSELYVLPSANQNTVFAKIKGRGYIQAANQTS